MICVSFDDEIAADIDIGGCDIDRYRAYKRRRRKRRRGNEKEKEKEKEKERE